MRWQYILLLLLLAGCTTKYVVIGASQWIDESGGIYYDEGTVKINCSASNCVWIDGQVLISDHITQNCIGDACQAVFNNIVSHYNVTFDGSMKVHGIYAYTGFCDAAAGCGVNVTEGIVIDCICPS